MQNNLLNIRNNNPYYQLVSRDILKHIPKELKTIAENIPQLPILSTDNYFLHYTIYPILATSNEDQVLQKVLDIYREYMKSKEYQSAKILTTLDHDLSMIHSIQLTRVILEKIREKMKDKLDRMRSSEEGRKTLSSISPQMRDDVDAGAHLDALMNRLFQDASQGNQKAQQLLQQITSTAVRDTIDRLHKKVQEAREKGKGLPKEVKEVFGEAKKTTEKAKDLKDLMSGGRKAGKTGTSFEKLLDLTEHLLSVEGVEDILTLSRKITDHMPRFTHIRKQKDKHGTELFGYRLTRNVEHALARELALPDELFYYKLASQGLLSKEKIRIMEGAYYVIIDKSGSMMGRKTV